MLIVVTRFQFRLFWCSHGDIDDPWYLYLVGNAASGSTRATCLGVVRRYRTRREDTVAWHAISYEDTLSQPIVSQDRHEVCEMAAVVLLNQLLYPGTTMAEWAVLGDMDDEDEWVMPLLSDIQATYARVELVCLLK